MSEPRFSISVLIVTALLVGSVSAENLVRNPSFETTDGEQTPAHWTSAPPIWEAAAIRVRATDEGLFMDADNPFAVGEMKQVVEGVKGGKAYAIEATCGVHEVEAPYRSLLVRVLWTRQDRALHPAGMLVRGPVGQGTQVKFSDVLVAPDEADGAVLSLETKWLGKGSVVWKRVAMEETSIPKPRKVRIGTVYLRPRNSTIEKNMQLWSEQIDAAGKLGLDIVCLGELIEIVGTGKGGVDVAKPIPGAATEELGKVARRNNIWVVAGLAETDGETLYNTAVLIDRKGQLAGKYRKVHLPREEWKKGVTPGNEYPVFETEFGKVAVEICYDWFFPEATEIFALKGAEIVFSPTWGNTLPDADGCVDGESTFRVRARDNGVYMVPSVYDGASMVIDPMGRILASNRGKEGVFWAEVDLNTRECLDWVGHWRSIGPRHRRPETYSPLTESVTGR